jgi:hypothetical protein
MPSRCCEFVDSRLRRSPPDRASAVPYGQAGENAMRFPHLAHRPAAAHKLHSATATTSYEFDSGKGEPISRLPALAYSPRKLSKRPGPSHSNHRHRIVLLSRRAKAYGDDSGHNCGWYAGGTGPGWGRALGVEVRQALRLVSLVIARSATGDLMTVQGRLC